MAGPLEEPVTRGAGYLLGGLGASGARRENALRYVLGNAERWRDGASGDVGGEVEVASRRSAGKSPARSSPCYLPRTRLSLASDLGPSPAEDRGLRGSPLARNDKLALCPSPPSPSCSRRSYRAPSTMRTGSMKRKETAG